MINPFTGNAFSLMALSTAINKVPNKYNRLGELGVFRQIPITKVQFAAEEIVGLLNMLNSVPRGGVAPKNTVGKRQLRNFTVPHYPLEDVVLPDDAQGVRAFGTENTDETVANVLMNKMAAMRDKFDITREYLRMGALKGIVLDPDQTTIYNYFTEFGVSQKSIDFALDVDTTDVNGKCREVINYVEDNLKGETVNGYRALVSQTFYDYLVKHPKVVEAYKYFQTTQQLANDLSKQFTYGGIVFEPYRANSTDPAGAARKFIDDNKGYIVPLGASCFAEVIAPGTFMEAVNAPGLPYYAKTEPRSFGMGLDIHAQMNVLPICVRPELTVEITV
jgi:hypothetical protein